MMLCSQKYHKKEGIKRFGEQVVAAMSKEYQQLNYVPMPGKPFLGPISNDELSGQDSKKSLESVNLIKNDVERSRG